MPVLEAVSQVAGELGQTRPQVMLDLEVYEIDHQFARNMGIHIPDTFNLFNIPAAALAGARADRTFKSLINQLISGGGINQANSSAISGLLAQLQGRDRTSRNLQPAAGHFRRRSHALGLSLDTSAAQLSLNESWVKHLDHATLRAAQGNDATFRLGPRFPMINASFAPIFNTAAISQVLQNESFQAPIPFVQLRGSGAGREGQAVVSGGIHVGLELEMQVAHPGGNERQRSARDRQSRVQGQHQS